MPRVTIEQAKTATLREIYETELARPKAEHMKIFISEIEKELERRGELVVVQRR
jgi:ribosomal protein L18E